MQIFEGLGTGTFAWIGFPRPFRTVERNQGSLLGCRGLLRRSEVVSEAKR
jgi:hypothetical protein